MTELLPCPFCGSTLTAPFWGFTDACQIACHECGASSREAGNLEAAVQLWNRRVEVENRDAAAIQTLRDFYDTERNCQLSSFWDAGWAVQVGDTINGLSESSGGLPDPVEAIEWLREWMERNPVEGENGD